MRFLRAAFRDLAMFSIHTLLYGQPASLRGIAQDSRAQCSLRLNWVNQCDQTSAKCKDTLYRAIPCPTEYRADPIFWPPRVFFALFCCIYSSPLYRLEHIITCITVTQLWLVHKLDVMNINAIYLKVSKCPIFLCIQTLLHGQPASQRGIAQQSIAQCSLRMENNGQSVRAND